MRGMTPQLAASRYPLAMGRSQPLGTGPTKNGVWNPAAVVGVEKECFSRGALLAESFVLKVHSQTLRHRGQAVNEGKGDLSQSRRLR